MTSEKKPDPKAPSWLFIRENANGTVYFMDYRRSGTPRLKQVIEGEFTSWRQAAKAGEKIIDRIVHNAKSSPLSQVRCEELCNEIVKLKRAMSPAMYEQTEIFYRLHIVPYLNDNCPYASELNATVWHNYKTYIRLKNPSVALFNHWKFFVMLFKYAFEKGILKTPTKLPFNEEREDFREEGLVIPDSDLEKLIEAATPMWRDRIVIGRYTGMRPGEVRCLRKAAVDFETWVVSLKKEETKTRSGRSFVIESDLVKTALLRRLKNADGPYLFPSGSDRSKPLDKSLKGWNAYRAKAKLKAHYTPHDLRHTYLTEMFKTSENPALICFQAGLSLEEATKTYLHFTHEDTRSIAKLSASLSKVKGYK